MYQEAHFIASFFNMQAELVFSCSAKNGDYFMCCSRTFVKHAQFHIFIHLKAVYMAFLRVLHQFQVEEQLEQGLSFVRHILSGFLKQGASSYFYSVLSYWESYTHSSLSNCEHLQYPASGQLPGGPFVEQTWNPCVVL
jgi:hypothetical protein